MSKTQEIVLVALLRQPRYWDINEMRSDPFWEFGSFGLTGCHQRNLMHPKRAAELTGGRFAFVQGGDAGFKLVFLTDRLTAIPYADRTEVRWTAGKMPFRYEEAPVIVDPSGGSDFPELFDIFKDVNRGGWMGKFASKFRSRCQPLPAVAAAQMIEVYEERRRRAARTSFARIYVDALPFNPPKTDYERRATYERMLERARSL